MGDQNTRTPQQQPSNPQRQAPGQQQQQRQPGQQHPPGQPGQRDKQDSRQTERDR